MKDKIRNILIENGADFVGFSDVSEYIEGELAGLKNAVTFGVCLSKKIISGITDKPTYTYFHHYRTANTLIDQLAFKVFGLIQRNGHNAVPVPASQSIPNNKQPYSALFSHKVGAVLSGLGWIGKNNLFISKDFGPGVRLGTILTDMPININNNSIIENQCKGCNECVNACPAMAIGGEKWTLDTKREDIFDAKACSDYMNTHFKHIGRGSVCGICIRVCPYHNKLRIKDYRMK